MLVVANVAGEIVEVSVTRGETIADVKRIVEKRSGVPVEEQRLFIGTEEFHNRDHAPTGHASLIRQSAVERLGFPDDWPVLDTYHRGKHEITGNTASGTAWKFETLSTGENTDGEGGWNAALIFGDLGMFFKHEITNLSYTQYSEYRMVDLRGCKDTIDLGHLRSFAPCLVRINKVYRFASLFRGHSNKVTEGNIKLAEARLHEAAEGEDISGASLSRVIPAFLRLPEAAKGWRSLWVQI